MCDFRSGCLGTGNTVSLTTTQSSCPPSYRLFLHPVTPLPPPPSPHPHHTLTTLTTILCNHLVLLLTSFFPTVIGSLGNILAPQEVSSVVENSHYDDPQDHASCETGHCTDNCPRVVVLFALRCGDAACQHPGSCVCMHVCVYMGVMAAVYVTTLSCLSVCA